MSVLGIIPNQGKAVFLAKRQLSELVCDAVNLEGIDYTLLEIQALLDGDTVGGHEMSDQRMALNQADTWHCLFDLVKSNEFEWSKTIACQLHKIAGDQEAMEWGCFRTGGVTIAGTDYLPPSAGELDVRWQAMVTEAAAIDAIYDRAIFVFLQMARQQFFYDVNKRMGRFMMNGIFLAQGYPVINLPAKKQMEFNQLMLGFYVSGEVAAMTDFMKSCLEAKVIKIMSEKWFIALAAA